MGQRLPCSEARMTSEEPNSCPMCSASISEAMNGQCPACGETLASDEGQAPSLDRDDFANAIRKRLIGMLRLSIPAGVAAALGVILIAQSLR